MMWPLLCVGLVLFVLAPSRLRGQLLLCLCLWRVFEPSVCCLRPLIEYCPLWLSFA